MIIIASIRVELLRLSRSGLLLGVLGIFVFFGLSGPALALYMPEILAAAASTEQLTIEAAPASPQDGIALFNQSAMQLGLILAVAVAITSLSWDSRPGSSIFYRTRLRNLAQVTLPRLVTDWCVVVLCYLLALSCAALLTTATIGALEITYVLVVGLSSALYLIFAMSVGFLVMSITRRTVPALAATAVVMLMLPVLNSFGAAAVWSPTGLLTASSETGHTLVAPTVSALVLTVICVSAAVVISQRHTLRRES